jgi:hypothetical protein
MGGEVPLTPGITMLERSKMVDPAPRADAVTWYGPGVALAVAFTAASPPEIVPVALESVAEAPSPFGFTTKLTTPPLTGSTGLLAVTMRASGLLNGLPA